MLTSPHVAARLPLPAVAPPIQAREVDSLPRGEDWVYEFLWGGERVRAIKDHDAVHILSRDGKDFTNRFPRIAAAVAKLRSPQAILDGEILHLDSYPEAASRFLAGMADELSTARIAFLAYDLLGDRGRDTRNFSLLCRRLMLAAILQGAPILLSPLIGASPEIALTRAARTGVRGVVAKRGGSMYRPNSLNNDWVKVTLAPTRTVANAQANPWKALTTRGGLGGRRLTRS